MSKIILDEFETEDSITLSRVIGRWEYYRIWYVIILIVSISIMGGIEHSLTDRSAEYWSLYFEDVYRMLALANVLYCGVYVKELRSKFKTGRYLTDQKADDLFALGLKFSVSTIVFMGIGSIFFLVE